MERTPTLIVILGPTASGKTAVAIEVAKHFSAQIISADSRQFFREMNIGVARPSPDELNAVRHHFIAHRSIHENYSAGSFETDALALLSRLFETNPIAVCTGGSALYITALIEGLDSLPHNRQVNSRWLGLFHEHGLQYLQDALLVNDPEYFSKVDTANHTRLIRALEVIELTGQKVSALRKQEKTTRPFRTIKVGLHQPRAALYQRIDARVDEMIASGLIDEVRVLLPYRDLAALNTVGYKELFDHFLGLCPLDKAIEKIKQHTRNYAKRQLTWWRRDGEITWLDPVAQIVIGWIEKELGKG